MEDILASIRRIISDEVASAAREPSAAPAPAVAQADPAEAEVTSAEVERSAPELPPFVSRYSQSRAETRPVEPARERPAAPSAYAPVGRVPAADPFLPRRASALPASPAAARPLAARAEPVFTPPAPRPSLVRAGSAQAAAQAVMPAPEEVTAEPLALETITHEAVAADPDARLAAALLDIDLVEQAVQAELATMSAEPVLDAATADLEETQAMMPAGPESDAFAPALFAASLMEAAEPMPVDGASALPSVDEPMSAAELPVASSGPETARLPVTPPEVENANMQATAKPFQAARAAASDLADERRAEPRHEARFLPTARPAATGAATPVGDMQVAAPQPAEAASAAQQRLISGSTNHAVSAAFGSLARTVASNSRTVDDLVTEALRPMLKEWLDENLPALVERLVRAEIERVSRQGQ